MRIGHTHQLRKCASRGSSDGAGSDELAVGSIGSASIGRLGLANKELTQRAFTAILEHFVATGRAPHYSELAEIIGVDLDVARDLQRIAADEAPAESCWLARDTDHVESWAPFSNVPTHLLISVDGIQKWYGQ